MAQRGRKPALQVIPFIPGQGGRPPPPSELDATEARIWRAVIDALPAFWIDGAGEHVLRRLVAQAAILERREQRLRALRAQDRDADEEADELVVAHSAAAKTVAYLLASCAPRRDHVLWRAPLVRRSSRRRGSGHGRSERVARRPNQRDRRVTAADVIAFIRACPVRP